MGADRRAAGENGRARSGRAGHPAKSALDPLVAPTMYHHNAAHPTNRHPWPTYTIVQSVPRVPWVLSMPVTLTHARLVSTCTVPYP